MEKNARNEIINEVEAQPDPEIELHKAFHNEQWRNLLRGIVEQVRGRNFQPKQNREKVIDYLEDFDTVVAALQKLAALAEDIDPIRAVEIKILSEKALQVRDQGDVGEKVNLEIKDAIYDGRSPIQEVCKYAEEKGCRNPKQLCEFLRIQILKELPSKFHLRDEEEETLRRKLKIGFDALAKSRKRATNTSISAST